VIEIDALWPSVAYAGNLYSTEFFSACARRLKKGGVMCTWCPTGRVEASFRRAFPHVLHFRSGDILLGSMSDFETDRRSWRDRALSVRSYLGPVLTPEILAGLRSAQRPPRLDEVSLNEDLFPRDEFRTPEVN
jgi:hypothetical protein